MNIRIILLSLGLIITVICWVAESESHGSLSIGYFLVAFGLIMSAAIWKARQPQKDPFWRFQIYQRLALGSLPLDELAREVTQSAASLDQKVKCSNEIALMIDEGQIEIIDGKARIFGNDN